VLIAGIFVVYSAAVNPQLMETYIQRAQNAGDDPLERIAGANFHFIDMMFQYPLGIGMGQQSQVEAFRVKGVEFIEDNRSRLAIESGIPGVAAQLMTLLLLLNIVILAWQTESEASRIGVATIGLPMVYQLCNSLWFDHNASALWWFVVGAWLAATIRASVAAQSSASRPRKWLQEPVLG